MIGTRIGEGIQLFAWWVPRNIEQLLFMKLKCPKPKMWTIIYWIHSWKALISFSVS